MKISKNNKLLLASTLLFLILIVIGFYRKLNAQTGTIIASAGDISPSSIGAQMRTSDTVIWINPTTVLALGDNQYPDGTLSTYNQYYNPTWGRFKSKTKPVPGNHEYHTSGASGYFDYFNGVGVQNGIAGERGKGYYSFNVGSWHMIALNSELDTGATGAQTTWLANDLNANRNTACTLAFWHTPRWSSGQHGSNTRSAAFIDKLYQYKADLVLTGHDHTYERFAPQNPQGQAAADGIREFVVGTGGAGLYSWGGTAANSQFKQNTSHGVLKLTLNSNSYAWQFIKDDTGHTVLDSGSGNCVGGTIPTGPTQPVTITNTRTPTPGARPGDCEGADGDVDILDFQKLQGTYNKTPGQTGYVAACNFATADPIIDLLDFQILANNFGR